MTDEENKLHQLLTVSPSIFMNQCILKFDKGEKSDFCTYVQLKVLKDSGKTLNTLEEEMLSSLFTKYGEIDTSKLMDEYDRSKKKITVYNATQYLDDILKDIRLSVRKAHEKNPQDGYAGYLGFLNEIWDNRNNKRSITYNAENVKELSQYFFESKTRIYELDEKISIKLKPGVLLHILVGHL